MQMRKRAYIRAWSKPAYQQQQMRRLAAQLKGREITKPIVEAALLAIKLEASEVIVVHDESKTLVNVSLKHGVGSLNIDTKELNSG